VGEFGSLNDVRVDSQPDGTPVALAAPSVKGTQMAVAAGIRNLLTGIR
jgi:hypothetical protein